MGNPIPAKITNETWRTWEETRAVIPGVRLGGIYANKSGYHNTVEANLDHWPGNYSVRFWLDLNGIDDKARAIDWTMSGTEMRKRTKYLRDSALNSDDDRLRAMREFYGTLDGKTVYGLIKDDEDGPWRRSSSDSSHLWHIHGAAFAAFVGDWTALAGIVSVLSGESLAAWRARTGSAPKPSTPKPSTPAKPTTDWTQEAIMSMPTLKQGARGTDVGRLQSLLAANGFPPRNSFNSKGEPDDQFGDGTGDSLEAFQEAKRVKNSVRNGKGDRICGRYSWTDLLGA